ncbi:MAG: penicillin-binding protein 2 [Candidatus Peregrinibacteria bacterium]|nr:penicillin-binding protein 2 [Candidatus Peregrinibacteria bacterium]
MRRVSYSSYRSNVTSGNANARIFSLLILVFIIFAIIVGRLFQLQVLRHDVYSETAKDQHFGAIDLPARRGDIYVKDSHSGELSKLATNTTLDLLYVDPLVAENKQEIANKLTPLLFPIEEYEACAEEPDECFYDIKEERRTETLVVTDTMWDIESGGAKEVDKEIEEEVDLKSYPSMAKEIADEILRKISQAEVDFVVLKRDASDELMADLVNERLPGIFIDHDRFMVYGDPTLIPDGQVSSVSRTLASHLDQPASSLEAKLTRRKVRYVFLKNKLSPDTSRAIKELDLLGVVLLPEHWRFYPEGDLASHLVGFINRENVGQYGLEGYFNIELEGKKGAIYAESDPFGRQITVGGTKIVNAVDGDTLILTIDRIVQKKVEEILEEQVELFKADSGQVIIMNPFSGAIIAMANYPSFDPNVYTDSYGLRELDLEAEEKVYATTPIFKQNERGRFVPIEEEDLDNDEVSKFVYENLFGPGVFKNKVVSEFYEPGSVFKPIVMAIALDAKEVTPEMTFEDDGPLTIDEFEIKNSDGEYHGETTMTEVLEKSLNTGMSYVAKKLGKRLMYKYIKNFGFGEYTNVQLEGETKGAVDYYTHWSRAQMLTTSFGQGIVVTPLQMITAWAALANGGRLMQPYIIDSVIREGEVIKAEPEIIQKVISEESSSIITSMLVSTVRQGHGRPADITGHLIAGKTGTSQIAGSDGKYEEGEGSVITSFAGYFPALQPQFVMLVKFDRPRIGENTWGSTTGAPTFKRIAEFLIDYYNIQPSS